MTQKLTYFVSTSAAVIEDNNIQQDIFTNVNLQITNSSFGVSGSRINLLSGNTLLASFPYDQTDLYIDSASAAYSTSSAISSYADIQYFISSPNISFNTSSYFKIVNTSSLEEIINIGLNNTISTGYISVISSSTYSIQLYTGLSENSYNFINITDITGSLINSTSSFGTTSSLLLTPTSSTLFNINVTASYSPYILLDYEAVGNIPVGPPKDSVSLWNTYLGTNASFVFTSSGFVYILGDNLASQTTLNVPGAKLQGYESYRLTNLNTLSIVSSTITGSPIISGSPDLNFLNISGSRLRAFPSSSISGSNVKALYINNARISGSLSSSYLANLEYFNCSYNNFEKYVSGSTLLNSLVYFNGQNNAFSQSAVDGILYDLAYSSSAINGVVNLTGSGNATTSSAGGTYVNILRGRGWTVIVN
jgi:hypothetical protein